MIREQGQNTAKLAMGVTVGLFIVVLIIVLLNSN
jgi:hypothetical protein